MSGELKTAKMTVTVGTDAIGRLTTFGNSISVSEEMVSGANDTTSTDNAVVETYIPVSVGETANVGGICLVSNDGESAIVDATRDATEGLVVEYRNPDGSGTDYTGFFTNYEKTAELPNVQRFTAQFRVNSVSPVAAS
jgi:hypothetical protein